LFNMLRYTFQFSYYLIFYFTSAILCLNRARHFSTAALTANIMYLQSTTRHITFKDASCQYTFGTITSRCVKCNPLCHQITVTFPRNYKAAVYPVLAAVLHKTPVKENVTAPVGLQLLI